MQPLKKKNFTKVEQNLPETLYSKEYLADMMDNPNLIRNVAICGHLHHGKSTFMDMIIEQTHNVAWGPESAEKSVRYTDTLFTEQERGCSFKCTPMTFLLPDTQRKNFLVNLIDTPGHVNFSDEVSASLRLSDCVVLCVDAIDGIMLGAERVIRLASLERLPVLLMITKIDRLVVDLPLAILLLGTQILFPIYSNTLLGRWLSLSCHPTMHTKNSDTPLMTSMLC